MSESSEPSLTAGLKRVHGLTKDIGTSREGAKEDIGEFEGCMIGSEVGEKEVMRWVKFAPFLGSFMVVCIVQSADNVVMFQII